MTNYTVADARYDSRSAACKTPFGAVRCGESVTFTFSLSERLKHAHVFLCTAFEGREVPLLMDTVESDPLLRRVSVSFAETGNRAYWFCVNDGSRLLYYGAKDQYGGTGVLTADYVLPYQLTVYDPAYTTPDWFKDGVAYHIFVDRFARGEGLGGLARSDCHESLGRTVVKHESWEDEVLFRPLPGKKHYEPCDFFGGDLKGVESKLDYLAELGVTVLYLSPIFESPSNHKYNTSDYLRIDPMFGTEEDFARLCEKARQKGIRIMLDGVFSHTGDDSLYFDKYRRYGSGACVSPDSPYFGWYDFTLYPDKYKSWWGFTTLPEVNENSPSYRRFIATDEQAVLKRWVRLGASGWRLDVADELPDDFIALLRKELKSTDPEAVLLGEVWEDASNKFSMGTQRRYVHGDELDSVMNYPLRDAIVYFFAGRQDAYRSALQLEALRENYPAPFYESCLNLLSSHDVPRALTLLGGGPDKDSGLDREEQAVSHLCAEARQKAKDLLKAAYAAVLVLPGVPCIYYGDEVGMEGCMDPFNRRPYPWGKEDESLRACLKEWIALRRSHSALGRGEARVSALHKDVLLIERKGFAFLANRSCVARTVTFDADGMTPLAATNGAPDLSAPGRITLPPRCAVLLG